MGSYQLKPVPGVCKSPVPLQYSTLGSLKMLLLKPVLILIFIVNEVVPK